MADGISYVPQLDTPTVTSDGTSLKPLIDGVIVRYQRPVEDRRGEIVEVYRESWGISDAPHGDGNQVRVRPGAR